MYGIIYYKHIIILLRGEPFKTLSFFFLIYSRFFYLFIYLYILYTHCNADKPMTNIAVPYNNF